MATVAAAISRERSHCGGSIVSVDLHKRAINRVRAAVSKAQVRTCVVTVCGSQVDAGSSKEAAIKAGKKIKAGKMLFRINIRHHLRSLVVRCIGGVLRNDRNDGKWIKASNVLSINITNPITPTPVPNSFQCHI